MRMFKMTVAALVLLSMLAIDSSAQLTLLPRPQRVLGLQTVDRKSVV